MLPSPDPFLRRRSRLDFTQGCCANAPMISLADWSQHSEEYS
ncbi:unnamed protein product [Musa acuminata subsp. malaccensis]|uniref:(wild Malaysian banana) hypothetical protein n=1 Tax=Musa acuminata subsp. malaccensis TaxID=214687 RepID=A0A804IUL7_MUSAM|nr:unnamed protein product [Musa acuminata subsp. malaccensis]